MSLRRLLSYARVILASMSPAIADPGSLLDGAQLIPSRQGHTIVIPPSSPVRQDDRGVRASTNVRFVVPAQTAMEKPAMSGPPFPGYNFETPASLACIYIYNLGQQAPYCNPNTLTQVATGGSRAIALVDAYHYLTTYSKQFGLPVPTASSFQTVYASGRQPARNLGWELEEALDIRMAHAMAPNAKIYLV